MGTSPARDVTGHAFGGRSAHWLHDWLLVGPEPHERNAFHGAATTQQLLAAGLIDELRLHIAPLLLGDGRHLFEPSVDDLPLEMIDTVATRQAVHSRYRVIR